MEVRHGPGGKQDNRAVNLSYGTPAQNSADRERDGTVPLGEQNHMAQLTAERVIEIRQRYALGGISLRALAAEYDVSHMAISKVIRRETWRHV
jgi:hypothetical protein